MLYITMNYRNEIIKRYRYYESIRENLIDVNAQLEIVKQRDPNSLTKSTSEYKKGNTGSNQTNKAIQLSILDDNLTEQKMCYELIIKDYEKGYRLLSENEKKVLKNRYIRNLTIEKTAEEMSKSIATIKRLTNQALMTLESQMTKI
ncbi:MAG: sigma factor-like helix-turn-helix DNA-binding protein [Candidatus Izemoplasmatales bacterium]|nr:sigma factor-like helix-turn-helix DNA-binding protein [Candidatus Izemoplasmatales bacterium]